MRFLQTDSLLPGCSSFWGSKRALCLKFHQIKISFNRLKAEREARDESVQAEGGSPLLPRRAPRSPAGNGDSGASEAQPRALSIRWRQHWTLFPAASWKRLASQCPAAASSPFRNSGTLRRGGLQRSWPGRRGEFAERSPFNVVIRGCRGDASRDLIPRP